MLFSKLLSLLGSIWLIRLHFFPFTVVWSYETWSKHKFLKSFEKSGKGSIRQHRSTVNSTGKQLDKCKGKPKDAAKLRGTKSSRVVGIIEWKKQKKKQKTPSSYRERYPEAACRSRYFEPESWYWWYHTEGLLSWMWPLLRWRRPGDPTQNWAGRTETRRWSPSTPTRRYRYRVAACHLSDSCSIL